MRELKVKDIRPASKIISIMNVGDEIKNIVKNNANAENAGIEIIGLILKKYGESEEAEDAIATFLAGPFEMSADEVKELSLTEFADNIKAIGGIKALSSFFKSVRA